MGAQSVYRVTTDQGTYNVTVDGGDDATPPPAMQGPSKTGQSMSSGYFEQLPGAQGMRWHPPAGTDAQPQGDELHRPDNSLLGLPPEMAVTAPLGVGASVANAAVNGGSRLAAAGKATMAQVAPVVKYEATKTALEHMGVPSSIAIMTAMAVSGYRHGAKPRASTPRVPKGPAAATAAAPEAVAAEAVAPNVSPPAPPVAEVAPTAPVAAPPHSGGSALSPQRIRNEVGLAARQGKLALTPEQLEQADALVAKGTSAPSAVRAVATGAPPTAPPVTPKFRLNAAETTEYVRLRNLGKSHADAAQAIEMQRELASKLGAPSSETVRTKVADRNRTGRWP